MEISEVLPAAVFSLYLGVSNIACADRICQAYRRLGVVDWLAEPTDCRGAGVLAIAFSAALLITPALS
jgi:hypothetical protein